MLLEKAKDLGGRLEKAFSSPSGMPWAQISLATGSGSAPSWTGGSLLLAEVGTVQLEFFGLAHHSGEGHFREKAQRVIDLLDQNGGPLTGRRAAVADPRAAGERARRGKSGVVGRDGRFVL